MVSFTCMAGKNGKHYRALSQGAIQTCAQAQMSLEATCPCPHISPQIPGFGSLSGSHQLLWLAQWSFDLSVELLCYGNTDNNPWYKRRWWQGKVNTDTANTEGIIPSICGLLLLYTFTLSLEFSRSVTGGEPKRQAEVAGWEQEQDRWWIIRGGVRGTAGAAAQASGAVTLLPFHYGAITHSWALCGSCNDLHSFCLPPCPPSCTSGFAEQPGTGCLIRDQLCRG